MLLSLCVLTFGGLKASASAAPAPETATGTVIDQYGDPLTGASVLVVGTTKGASTDIDGNFSIPGVERGQTIRVSMIGCKPVETKWEGTPLNITLEDDVQSLNEVVVVGFGVQKKANLTGAVATVSAAELTNRPVSSVSDALQGLAPGLNVAAPSTGGNLSATRSMNIRGTGTIGTGASVTPLILIDGMEGALETVNPQDVENISILKDAAASSIYGSRAAGGVILVTTKKGKEGKITINYSDSFRWRHNIRMPKKMDSYNFALIMNEGSINAGAGQWLPDFKVDQIKNYMETGIGPTMFENTNNGHWEVWDYPNILPIANTDWLDEHFGKNPFSQEHNLTITGGTEKVRYYFSGSILSQEGILRYGNDNSQRYNLTGRVNLQLTNWLNFGYATKWWRNNYDAPSLIGETASNQFYHDVMRYWPLIPTVDPNGHYVRESYIPALMDGGRYNKTQDQLDQQFSFLVTPFEGFTVNADFNYRSIHNNTHRYYLNTYSYSVDDVAYQDNAAAMPSNSSVYDYNYKANYFNPNVYGTYQWTLNDAHEFKVMAGFQSEWYNQKVFSASRTEVLNDIPWLDTTNGTANVSGYTNTWSTAGFFGRINYDYKGRYLVEGNLRYDGTSRFRKGSRWSWSPSFSLGWNVANETWFEDIRQKINTLKVRYSWGRLGNQNTNSWYPTYSNMGYSSGTYGWLVNNQKQTQATPPSLVASTLTWEKNRTWDIGFDWGFFNNRLTGSFDYYNRKTMDMVGPGPDLPSVLGASVPNINSISMTSRGWEVTLGWRDRIQDFSYGVSFNISDYQITIDEYDNNPGKSLSIGSSIYGPYYEGAKLGSIWGFVTEGLAKTQEEMDQHLASVNQSIIAASGWSAGDIMYADIDGDGRLTQGNYTADDSGDWVIIGNNTPRYSYGANIDMQWKGFDLRIFMQGIGKRDYWASDAVFTGPMANNQWQAAALVQHLDYFRPADTTNPLGPNLDSYYPRPNWSGGRNFQRQSRYLQNAAYWRLKNVTLGYTIPQSITRKAYIENLRIFFSGENLATITDFTGTGDPELVDAYYNAYGYGKVYPLSRVLSFGLNITF
ncbi:MAG: TonB-dependent receptor [Paramuribaculum sp.]|nr:TonB-dependent receptor [Paramuribaculum sp.]